MSDTYADRYKISSSPVNDFFTGHIASASINESVYSNLPGRSDGPADAYRHIILSAELTRRYGEPYARLILNGHEFTGNVQDQTKEANEMDIHNNELGIKIGNRLRQQKGGSSWDNVVFEARKTINPNDRNGSGARWLAEDKWRVNPKDDDTGQELPTGHEKINWPPKWENKLYGDEKKRVLRYEDYDTRHEPTSSLSPADRELLWEYYPNLAATGGYVKLAQNTAQQQTALARNHQEAANPERQYTQAVPAFRLETMPQPVQKLYHAVEAHLTEYHQKNGLVIDEGKLQNSAMALASLGYSKKMNDAPLFNIKDGDFLIGEIHPFFNRVAMNMNQAAATPLEESVSRVQQAEMRFEQEREMKLAQSQSRGISLS